MAARSSFLPLPLCFASSCEMAQSSASSPALALSSAARVGLTLALRQRSVPRAPGVRFRQATALSWLKGAPPELGAAVPRPGARVTGRAPPLFRPCACKPSFISGTNESLQGPPIIWVRDSICLHHHRLLNLSRTGMTASQIASSAFTWATVAVLPFYTLMVVAPNANITKRTVESSAPYVALGLLYGYLLYLSWTPGTLRAMFASKYWLPEGIVRMFASEMTVASAWIHLLAVDLFAARQVYHDGIKNDVETRHSVSLCLLFCPIGILSHVVTKALAGAAGRPN